jgi:ribosomal protein S2
MHEVYALFIPTVGITDSDALPHSVLYPVPGNDDAFGSIFFFNQLAAKAVLVSKILRLNKKYTEFLLFIKKRRAFKKFKSGFGDRRVKRITKIFKNVKYDRR